jgi:hypothetical protein
MYPPVVQDTVNRAYTYFRIMVEEFAERMKNSKNIQLTKNERDPSHQEWYDWLYNGVEGRMEPPNHRVREVIDHISRPTVFENIPVQKDRIYLCDTNKCRQIITEKYHTLFQGAIRSFPPIPANCSRNVIQACLNHKETIRLARYCADDKTISPTTIQQLLDLICAKYPRFVVTAVVGGSVMVTRNKKGTFYNGEIYPLMEIDGKLYLGEQNLSLPYDTLESTGDTRSRINQWIDALTADQIEIPIRVPVFQEANVMTIHKAQGQSITGKVGVILSAPWCCSKQMLYTAATRCRNVEDLTIYADEPFDQKFLCVPRAKMCIEKSLMNTILKKQ